MRLACNDGSSTWLPRRELYDIRVQLMAEDAQIDPADSHIPGLSTDDIRPNVYEGGFKTWECAVDLAEYLLKRQSTLKDTFSAMHMIEVLLPDTCG